MVRKLSADELHRIAESNGFVAGAHRDEDEVQQIRDPFTERYLRNQNEPLELWKASVIFVIIFIEIKHWKPRCSFNANKINSAVEILYEGCPVPSNALVKDFLDGTAHHVRADSTSDQILSPFKTCWKKFFGTEIGDEYRRNIYTVRKISPSEIWSCADMNE